jgi:dUTP pyrophosphatase
MFKILDEACKPTRGSKHSAAVDLRSREDITIGAGETKLVPLGVKLDVEKLLKSAKDMYGASITKEDFEIKKEFFLKSHYFQLMLRSGLGKKGLVLPNGIGIIDIDYEDEIMMIIYNASGKKFTIDKGDRVGQIMLIEHKTDFLGVNTDEVRTGGFGSTGIK